MWDVMGIGWHSTQAERKQHCPSVLWDLGCSCHESSCLPVFNFNPRTTDSQCESDTAPQAGGLMSWVPQSGITSCPGAFLLSRSSSQPRRGSTWVAVGQGTSCARRPRTAPPFLPADPAGVELFGPSRANRFRCVVTVGFAHGYSCRSPAGSTERSNLFESHWSSQSIAGRFSLVGQTKAVREKRIVAGISFVNPDLGH